MTVEFGVLGPVVAHAGGRALELGHARRQAVLAVLLVDANQLVPADRLAGRIWGDDAPRHARNSLQGYISRLRLALAGADGVGITWQHDGYILTIDPMSLDLYRFGELLGQARASRDDQQARALFGQALGLWRGEAFAGLDGEWLHSVRDTLHQQRFAAEADHIDVRLRLGQHSVLLAELSSRARANPLDERLSGQLMLALHRCGRTGDALAQYQHSRHELARELGIDPGPELRRLHQQILAGDRALDPPVAPQVAVAAADPVPRGLPAPPPLFAGRASELSRLTSALPAPGDPAAMVIWAIDGTGGVGKTWLALRWAHDHVPDFPDGQLYVNLRGFGPSGSAVDPAEALRGFLEAFGTAAERIPAGLNAQISLYRSILAGKRVLVVLDNARDADQVRPLLPGSPGCLVVVTSRSHLTGLVAGEGARPLSLDLLTPDEAAGLLASRLGADRVAAEPEAVSEIITRCARLPLALALAAARGAAHPRFPLAKLAGELRDAAGGLDTFEANDAATDMRTVFSWSYHALSTDAAGLFRLLGLPRGPDISAPAAASLAGLSPQRCRRLLAELTQANLLTEHAPGRYTFHDLLRAYATEQAGAHENDEQQRAAVHRVLDHHLHSAHAAALLLSPRDPVALAPPQPGVTVESPASDDNALAWFTTECSVLLAAVEHAAETGFDVHAWQLAWALLPFLLRRGHWPELVAAEHTALAAARRCSDLAGQGQTLRGLALGYVRWGRLDDAGSYFRQAQQVFAELGDLDGQAVASTGLAEVADKQGRLADALQHAQETLRLQRAAGNRAGIAWALNGVGWAHALLGNYHQALGYCQQALPELEEVGSTYDLGDTWDSLGYIHHGLADYDQAAACYQHALDAYRDIGAPYTEAEVLSKLGDTYHAAGHPAAARKAWEQALDILDRLEHPDASQVRSKLDSLEAPAAGDGR